MGQANNKQAHIHVDKQRLDMKTAIKGMVGGVIRLPKQIDNLFSQVARWPDGIN